MQDSTNGKFPLFDASSFRVGIVVSEFNHDLTSHLLASALAELELYRVKPKNITTVRVAGCVEIPVMLQALAASKKYNCLIALGTVIRGDTPHFDYVCQIVADGIGEVMLDYTIPIGFGILTLNKKPQAASRLSAGAAAITAALQAAYSIKQLKK